MKIFSKEFDKAKNSLGEGLFIGEAGIYWLDIVQKKLFVKQNNQPALVKDLPENSSTIWKVESNRVFLISESGVCSFDLENDSWRVVTLFKPKLENVMRANDGVAIDKGICFFGTMERQPSGPNGSLYVAKPDKIVKLLGGIGIPNSFIPITENSFLVSDSLEQKIYKIELDETFEEITSKKLWLDLSSYDFTPDGGCIDEKGNIYIAMWNGASVHKYDLNAKLLDTYELPALQPTNCKLSNDNSSLYVTTAIEGMTEEKLKQYPGSGSLFKINLV